MPPGEVEGAHSGERGVREVKGEGRDVEVSRIPVGCVRLGVTSANGDRKRVLDRNRDAARGLQGSHHVDEPGGRLALPAVGRVHDDGARADLASEREAEGVVQTPG